MAIFSEAEAETLSTTKVRAFVSSPEPSTLIGEPVRLITRDQDWEDPLIENPSLTLHDGKYYLVYSGNWWESPAYALGYAVCESPLGPCVKPLDEPWFQLRTGRVG